MTQLSSFEQLHQLAWARSKFRWQVKLSDVSFPLSKHLMPRVMAFRLEGKHIKGAHTMIPDKEEGALYWFFMCSASANTFLSIIKRHAGIANHPSEVRLCSKLEKIKEKV